MKLETQAVEISAGAENPVVPAHLASEICKRIGWVRHRRIIASGAALKRRGRISR